MGQTESRSVDEKYGTTDKGNPFCACLPVCIAHWQSGDTQRPVCFNVVVPSFLVIVVAV